MMRISRHIFLLLLLPAILFTACEDKFPFDPTYIGEGEATLSVEVEFRPLDTALESRAAGDAVETINQLWVVIYKVNANGEEVELYEKVKIYQTTDKGDYRLPGSEFDINQTGNSADPTDAETAIPNEDDPTNIGTSGQNTPKAKFKLKNIPYGRYKMFAVANVDLTDIDCTTIAGLSGTRFEWKTDVSLDNQMFGYFTPIDVPTSRGDAPVLIINQPEVKIHSWIKRLVSKVTVSFDASELRESVRIYIKSVTIHDIPKSCSLGDKNSPNGPSELIANGESFTYYNPGESDNSQHDKWKMVLSRGSGPQGEVNHTETDRALYFFENMQGNFPGDPSKDKRQDENAVGTPIDQPADGPDYKDTRLYGTYIEVEAYYDSRNKDKISQGPIKYRFMLGKNTTYNYDAERNYHYKLTLKFRGWANEADWHISYREHVRTLLTPEPYYISYLYNQKMEFPARVVLNTTDKPEDFQIRAEIVENNWWPWDRDANDGKGARPAQFVPTGTSSSNSLKILNGFAWNEPAISVWPAQSYSMESYNPKSNYTNSNFIYGGSNYVGFLSLEELNTDIIGENYPGKGTGNDRNGYGPKAQEFLESEYKQGNIAHNDYLLNDPAIAKFDQIDHSVSLKIPMYTRHKQMVNATDFTGNNPFSNYSRYAKVRFTLWQKNATGTWEQISFKDEDGNEEWVRISTIYQVERLENPKAIYRDWDKADEFKVKLMLPSVVQTDGILTYKPFKSDGPWRASIMAQSEPFIQITGPDGKMKTAVGDYIEGSTDTYVEFSYKPSGTLGSSDRTRCGIIKVEYHDYNCIHLIFVRQGYHKGVYLGDANWSCYNVYSARGQSSDLDSYDTEGNISQAQVILTRSPLSIGTYYKRNNYNYGILESNNAADKYPWMTKIGNLSTTHITADNNLATPRDAAWGSIKGAAWDKRQQAWAIEWNAVAGNYENGKKFKVPTAANFLALMNNCKFGYGIVYADGSTTTATTITAAAGFYDYNNDGVDDAPVGGEARGMRACIVYEETNGNNIIFPFGAEGQGRRAQGAPYGNPSQVNWTPVSPWSANDLNSGMLAYGGMCNVLGGDQNKYRPLAYNLLRQSGALYWISVPNIVNNTRDNSYGAWDINYNTIRFNPHDYGSLGGNFNQASDATDAMPIRLIYNN